jgi:hypothetical protein
VAVARVEHFLVENSIAVVGRLEKDQGKIDFGTEGHCSGLEERMKIRGLD